jgi:diguanylate cyclase (GGDEF)-like protein
MFPWSWFDNRTLFSCQLLLAFVFAVLFFSMRRTNPNLRGIGTIALSFLFGVIGILLLFLRGSVPNLLSMTVANALVLISFTLQYRATLRFLGIRRHLYPVWALNTGTLLVVFYYSQIQHNIVLRVIASSLTIAVIRGLTSLVLFREARGRVHMRLFAFAMGVFALLSCARAVVSYLNGAPSNFLQNSSFQTIAMAGDLLYICIVGLFFCTMINSKILAQVKDQSEQDPLSGTFNRRGIEHRLSIELKRLAHKTQKLSIALIDIDYFKSINDTAGHAAGDDALRAVVAAIAAQLRATDLLGRYGGDEFLLILPQTRCTDAFFAVERIRKAVSSFSLSFDKPSITLSIGISEAVSGENADSLLSRADQALYQAKRSGRNCTRSVLQPRAAASALALEAAADLPSSQVEAHLS